MLGSAPSIRSLERNQYYGHPRNAFWPIMAQLFGFPETTPYEERARRVAAHGVAIWDVLASCERPTSMDADIVESSIRVNDFGAFLEAHPQIGVIFFNGAKAEASFRRYALPTLDAAAAAVRRVRLPSTSPANASWSFERKLDAWRVVLEAVAG